MRYAHETRLADSIPDTNEKGLRLRRLGPVPNHQTQKDPLSEGIRLYCSKAQFKTTCNSTAASGRSLPQACSLSPHH